MKFGVREITDVVFKAKKHEIINGQTYVPGQPVLYIDSAKTSTIEGTATTVYATGGRGNSRLIAWEGEKTLTFTVEDALLSDKSFHLLSGANLDKKDTSLIHIYEPIKMEIELTNIYNSAHNGKKTRELILKCFNSYSVQAPFNFFIFVEKDKKILPVSKEEILMSAKDIGGETPDSIYNYVSSFATELQIEAPISVEKMPKFLKECFEEEYNQNGTFKKSFMGYIDYYTRKETASTQMEIDTQCFGGYYYVEAATNFRRQVDGEDLQAQLIFPNVKIQSNFTFNMAATGDPSTFTFTMDAMPGYTNFDNKKKVLCVMQIIDNIKADPYAKIDMERKYYDSIVDNDNSSFSIVSEITWGDKEAPDFAEDTTYFKLFKKGLDEEFSSPASFVVRCLSDATLYTGEHFEIENLNEKGTIFIPAIDTSYTKEGKKIDKEESFFKLCNNGHIGVGNQMSFMSGVKNIRIERYPEKIENIEQIINGEVLPIDYQDLSFGSSEYEGPNLELEIIGETGSTQLTFKPVTSNLTNFESQWDIKDGVGLLNPRDPNYNTYWVVNGNNLTVNIPHSLVKDQWDSAEALGIDTDLNPFYLTIWNIVNVYDTEKTLKSTIRNSLYHYVLKYRDE